MAGKAKQIDDTAKLLPWIFVVLALVTLLLYAPAIKNDFVNYDDPDYVTSNPHVQKGLTPKSIKWAFTTGDASNWHPLTWISHMVDCQLYKLNPAGHHATNILFHTANVLLLFQVLRLMTGRMWPAAFVAALFAWHPLHVESVAWISERKDVLSTFFWLLTLMAYTLYVKESERKDGRKRLFYGLALFAFALGLLSKPMVVTLPCVLLLLDFWPFQRLNLGDDAKDEKLKPTIQLLLEKIPFFVLSIASCIVTYKVQDKGGAVAQISVLSLSERIGNAFVSYLRYVGKMFLPNDLSVLYPHPGKWPLPVLIAGISFVILASSAAFWFGRQRRYLAVGWFWFLGTLVPVIGLVQVGIQSMADRYSYIPHIGLFIIIAWGVADFSTRWKDRTGILTIAGGMALICCLWLTWIQEKYWKNSLTLFGNAVRVTKDNYLAYNNLGYFLDHEGRTDEAMTNYQRSLEINPNYDEARNNLGLILAKKGKYDEAIMNYEMALRINPNRVEVHNNLGNALSEMGRLDQAIVHYRAALKINPDHADAHNGLGIVYAMQGNFQGAIEELTLSLKTKPNDASAYSNLGNAYAIQHKLDEAVLNYKKALELRPEDAQAHNNLANVLTELGKLDEAVEHYGTALRLKADNPEAHYNLGLLLLRQGKKEDARTNFLKAIMLKPNYTEAQKQLSLLTVPGQ